jgi:hypothetical protein
MDGKTKEVENKTGPPTVDRQSEDDDGAEHAYYYDDAHGYQEFDPDKEDDIDNQ